MDRLTPASSFRTVSVVLPTYDRVELLRQAVASVLEQTFGDWELIVADDGSTDGTRRYLEELPDPRVRALWLPHSGNLAVVKNAALRVANGEWVAFLDSDDLWLPQKLERQLESMVAHPECGWSYTGFALIDERGAALPERPSSVYRPVSGWIFGSLVEFSAGPCMPATLARRSLLEELGGFDDGFPLRTDYDLFLRLAARSQVHALPETLTLVREHAGRTTSQRDLAELCALNARVFRKAAASAPTASLRERCRRQCARQLTARARALSRQGNHRSAFASMGRALLDAPFDGVAWRAAAGITLRSVRSKQ
jgi:glycosyltransferase involved in cell wall biosynthesis